ncbi:MAG: alpha/beta hydrolase [Candidatus Eremiobacteraeota bacterium]|nr:alpha/beta hydrolase [Candidatus Eremiobacteraeota bacterium]
MTLLFIHGSGFTGEAFAAQVNAFPDAYAPNLPGHDAPGAPEQVDEFAEFIEGYVRDHGLANPVLAGNSLGGAIALQCALRGRVPIGGIVLLGSGARLRVAPAILEGLERDFERTIAQLATLFFAEPSTERVDRAVERLRKTGQPQVARDFAACNAFDVLDRLDELSVPLLALTGEADVMTPPKFARALADRVAGAQARIVPRAGHLLMIERPDETNAAIRAFVDEIR